MKNVFLLLFVLVSHQFCFGQLLEKYSITPSRCETVWTGTVGFTATEYTGMVPLRAGELILKDDWIQAGYLEFDLRAIQHDDEELVTYLQSKDFFHIEKFPTARFDVTEPCEIYDNQVIVTGELTIKGVSNPEQFKVRIDVKDEQIYCTFMVTVNRVDYGIIHNSPSVFDDVKDEAISDEFVLDSKINFFKDK